MNSIRNQSNFYRTLGLPMNFAIVLLAIAGIAEAAPDSVCAKASQLTATSPNPLSPVYDDPDAGGEED